MARKTVTVRNKAGIHCRPTSVILLEVQKFPECRIKVLASGGETEINSMLSLISMGLAFGDELTVVAEGHNENEACEKISSLFEYEFDFPPQE